MTETSVYVDDHDISHAFREALNERLYIDVFTACGTQVRESGVGKLRFRAGVVDCLTCLARPIQ